MTTDRLRLRRFTSEDAPSVEAMLGDPEARRFFGHLFDEPELGRRWVQRNLDRYEVDGLGLWAMEDSSGAFLGDCGLIWQTLDNGERILEIGYHLAANARGQGFATEAAAACRDFAFERALAERVHSIVRADNAASHRVARRVHTHALPEQTYQGHDITLYWSSRPTR